MKFEPLFDFSYVQGYTAALQDVITTIENIQVDMKVHKIRQCEKTYVNLLKCMLKNRTILRENPNAFVRCNKNVDGFFEIFTERKG